MNQFRSFISLNIDSLSISKLSLIQDNVKSELRDYRIKWENPGKFHLTLRFLGDVEYTLLDEVAFELGRVYPGFEKISMVTSGINFFPDKKKPGVIFIELDDTGRKASILADEIENKLKQLGFKAEKKFIPHITIGRFRRESRKRINNNFHVNIEPVEIIFSSFYLMKSTLKPAGSIYEVISEFNLK